MKFRIVGLLSHNEVKTFEFEVVTAPSKCYFCGCQVDVANYPTFLMSKFIDKFIHDSHLMTHEIVQNLIAYSSLQYVVVTEISDDSENIKNLSKNLSFQIFCVRITRILKLNEKTLFYLNEHLTYLFNFQKFLLRVVQILYFWTQCRNESDPK